MALHKKPAQVYIILCYNNPDMFGRVLFYLIQWTWGLPQNLAGLFLYTIYRGQKHFAYRNTIVTNWKRLSGLSLGMFIFVWKGAPERMVAHEYGHSIQSMILGPFYFFAIGIPSLLWCSVPHFGRRWRMGKKSYFSFFAERWADHLGKVSNIRKTEAIRE